MSKLNATYIRIKINGEYVHSEIATYYSNDKITISFYEDIHYPGFTDWTAKIGQQFTLTIEEETLKAKGIYTLTRVGMMAKFECPVTTNLIFKKL